MSFQIHALPPAQFEPLFVLSDSELTKSRAARMIVDEKPGYPCRVSRISASSQRKAGLLCCAGHPGLISKPLRDILPLYPIAQKPMRSV